MITVATGVQKEVLCKLGNNTIEMILGYQYLKLRASRYPSHRFAAGPSHSQRHGRRWFLIPIPQNHFYCALAGLTLLRNNTYI